MNNDSDFLFTQFPGKEGSDIHNLNNQEEIKNILQQGIKSKEELREELQNLFYSISSDGLRDTHLPLEVCEELAEESIKKFDQLDQQGITKEAALHYFREGYKYMRQYTTTAVPYDDISENTVLKAFNELPAPPGQSEQKL